VATPGFAAAQSRSLRDASTRLPAGRRNDLRGGEGVAADVALEVTVYGCRRIECRAQRLLGRFMLEVDGPIHRIVVLK
jgi:hypothetical protein